MTDYSECPTFKAMTADEKIRFLAYARAREADDIAADEVYAETEWMRDFLDRPQQSDAAEETGEAAQLPTSVREAFTQMTTEADAPDVIRQLAAEFDAE